jgi:transposase
VLAPFVSLHRLECAGETLRHTLNVLAQVAPDWLLAQIDAEWFDRYSRRFDEYRFPKAQTERLELRRRLEPMAIGCSQQCMNRQHLPG